MGLSENQAKLRFRYEIRRLRDRLGTALEGWTAGQMVCIFVPAVSLAFPREAQLQ